MFEREGFIEACRRAAAEGQGAIRELVAEAVSDPARVAAAMGDRVHAGLHVLYRGPDLTILDFAWAPWMCFKPHDHAMWSVVGLYSGREDNVLWRRTPDRIEAAGARSLGTGEVTALGVDAIHSVVNPLGKLTRAIHVYGGDFFAPPRPRSEWDPESELHPSSTPTRARGDRVAGRGRARTSKPPRFRRPRPADQ